MSEILPGLHYWPGWFDRNAQETLLEAVRDVVRSAPLFTPTMPRTGKPFSVRMTNCGTLGWVSDAEGGYRYQAQHPASGKPWPPIPAILLDAWEKLTRYGAPPEACLINFYEAGARMGLHQDRDEAALEAPVLSVSLGDTCRFRFGGDKRNDPTKSFLLASGDVLTFGGPARLAFHGVDRILPGTSTLMPKGGRINLTLRRVTPP